MKNIFRIGGEVSPNPSVLFGLRPNVNLSSFFFLSSIWNIGRAPYLNTRVCQKALLYQFKSPRYCTLTGNKGGFKAEVYQGKIKYKIDI